MSSLIAYCGLDCEVCPAFTATRKNDDQLRQKVAEQWSKEYHSFIKPEDINCLGCCSVEELYFSHCSECLIRQCAKKKKIENCAFCDEYICKHLQQFFSFVPEAKTTLDGIRDGSISFRE